MLDLTASLDRMLLLDSDAPSSLCWYSTIAAFKTVYHSIDVVSRLRQELKV